MIEYFKKNFLYCAEKIRFKKLISTILISIFLFGLILFLVIWTSYTMNLKQLRAFYVGLLIISSIFLANRIYKMVFDKTSFKFNDLAIFLLSFFITISGSILFGTTSADYEKRNSNIPFFNLIYQKRLADRLDDYDQSFYENIRVYKNKDIHIDKTKPIHKMFENTYIKSKNFYNYIPNYKSMIIIEDKNNSLFKDKSLAGFYDRTAKTVNVVYDKNLFDTIPQIFEQNLAHEYNHYVLDMFSLDNQIDIKKIPTWFNEGISEYLAFGNSKNNNSLNRISDLQTLADISKWNEIRDDASHYAQSHYFICNLVNEKGQEVIKNILLDCKKLSFDEAFEKNVGISLSEYTNNFTDNLINHFNIKM